VTHASMTLVEEIQSQRLVTEHSSPCILCNRRDYVASNSGYDPPIHGLRIQSRNLVDTKTKQPINH
jgi:hypothetical protein